ncbi:MAG: SEC-C domain-containing protein [Anaerolineae bacterium]
MPPKRNDPCPCGSGKKYKHCCMPKDQASHLEALLWERAYRNLRTALVEFAQEEPFTEAVAEGLQLFWGDSYHPEALERMDEDEALLFFDWFAFDYRWGEEGQRLIERFAASEPEYLDERERALLQAWLAVPPGSAYRVEAVEGEDGTLHLQDLFADRWPEGVPTRVDVLAPAAAKAVEPGEILLGRPVPVGSTMRLSGSTVRLPGEVASALRQFIEEAEAAYKGEHPEASWLEFLRDRGYLFVHFAMRHAEEEGRPPVSFAAKEGTGETPRERRPPLPGRKVRRIGRARG